MEMMVETEHDGDSDCRSCNSALEILAQEASASAHGSASSTSPISAFLECDDGGQTIETCSALKTEVEKNGGNCRFILQVDIICDEAITVSSGQTVVVDGLSDDRYSSISIDPDFKSPNEVEWKAKPSVFIVEDGGQLSLEHVGFNGTATKGTRVVHNYGNLRVDSCEWGGYSSTDRVEYGGAVRHLIVVSIPYTHSTVIWAPFRRLKLRIFHFSYLPRLTNMSLAVILPKCCITSAIQYLWGKV